MCELKTQALEACAALNTLAAKLGAKHSSLHKLATQASQIMASTSTAREIVGDVPLQAHSVRHGCDSGSNHHAEIATADGQVHDLPQRSCYLVLHSSVHGHTQFQHFRLF